MNDELRRNVFVETQIEAYRNFLNDDWAARISSVSDSVPRLAEIVLDLGMDWRAPAYTAALPVRGIFTGGFAMPHFPKPLFRPSRGLWYIQQMFAYLMSKRLLPELIEVYNTL